MDPVSASSIHPLLRPVLPVSANAPLLAEGRTLPGEVLERLDGGTVLVRLGEQRVPAEAGVDLQPGDRFRARVERSNGELVLRLLPEVDEAAAGAERSLVAALRALLGEERSVGEVLRDLASALRATLAEGADPKVSALLAELAARGSAPVPEALAAALQGAAGEDPLGHALLMFAAASEGAAPEDARASAATVLQLLAGELGWTEVASSDPGLVASVLRSALGGLAVERVGTLDARGIARLVEAFHDVLARTLSALGRPGERLTTRAGGAPTLPAGREGALLAALFSGAGGESLRRRLVDASLARLDEGLRGRLLSFLLEGRGGEVREAASRAWSALELEQLLNGARREHGEPVHLELALPDLRQPARADVFLRGEREGDGHSPGESSRARVAVRFSVLGSVRADLALRDGRLAVRLAVEDEQGEAALSRALPELVERLSELGRAVHARVVRDAVPHPDPQREVHDIRFLRETPLMDIEG